MRKENPKGLLVCFVDPTCSTSGVTGILVIGRKCRMLSVDFLGL